MSGSINTTRLEQELARRRNDPPAIDVSDSFEQPKMPEPLPHCPQCGAAHAPGAKRCKRCRASLVRK